MKKDWILTEEEKIMKRRKHRNRDSEKKDADSSSMTCPSPDDRAPEKPAPDKNQNNIIILPILPLSLGGEKDSSDVISNLNKQDIISYINNKLNLSLDNVNIETIGQNGARGSNNFGVGGSAIIVYPNQLASNSKNLPESSSADYRDANLSSDNSSSSFTGSFGGTNANATSTQSFEQPTGTGEVQFTAFKSGTAESGIAPSEPVSFMQPNSTQRMELSSTMGPNLGRKHAGPFPMQWKISDNVYKHAIQLEYTTNPLKYELIGQEDERNLRKLNKLEENRLDEVNQHLRPLCVYVQGNKENKKFIQDMAEGLQCFEHAIKKIIIAVKNIQSFKCMCQDDQIALLKGSAGEIKGLLNIRYFNPTQELCIVPNPNDQNSILIIDHGYLKKTYGEELYNRCKNFFLAFRPDWKDDDSIINLMAMIMLFYPNRVNLCHREYIMLEYLTYCHLLQRYLEVKYNSVCEAKSTYLALMSQLEQLHELNDECMELILKLADPKYIGPLTVELYDLNKERPAG